METRYRRTTGIVISRGLKIRVDRFYLGFSSINLHSSRFVRPLSTVRQRLLLVPRTKDAKKLDSTSFLSAVSQDQPLNVEIDKISSCHMRIPARDLAKSAKYLCNGRRFVRLYLGVCFNRHILKLRAARTIETMTENESLNQPYFSRVSFKY